MRMSSLAAIALALLVAGCAASPLWVENSQRRWSGAEIPRDARGEPIFEKIRAPAGAHGVATARSWTPAPTPLAEGDGDPEPEAGTPWPR
ncbi:MAG: hypothetical protein ACK4MX_00965 [Thermaurantiacus sp.]